MRNGSAAGSTKGSTSRAFMPRFGRIRRRHTWSISPRSATATTRIPPASAISITSGSNDG